MFPDLLPRAPPSTAAISMSEHISRFVGKTSTRVPWIWSPDICGPPGGRDLYTRALGLLIFLTSWQDFCEESLQELSTKYVHNISKQDLLRSLDFLAKNPWKISLQELPTKSPDKTSFGGSPELLWTSWKDLYGRPLYKSSLQDLLTGPKWRVPVRVFSQTLYKTSMGDLCLWDISAGAFYNTASPGIYGSCGRTSTGDL